MDRNSHSLNLPSSPIESLSARRAWIEIATPVVTSTAGVSLSARRAWIEIGVGPMVLGGSGGRSPQGERG